MGSTILYWNVNAVGLAPPLEAVATFIADQHPQVVVLGEIHPDHQGAFADTLSSVMGRSMRLRRSDALNPSTSAVYAPDEMELDHIESMLDGRALVHRLRVADLKVLLIVVHLIDARNNRPEARLDFARRVAEMIRSVEQEVGHSRTVVVGDFNMNPGDVGMTAGPGFNAVSDRRIAERRTRQVHGRVYPFFYNPSWRLLGDAEGPPGTYYWRSNDGYQPYWHLLDQVVVRPAVLNDYRLDVRIPTGRGVMTERGLPARERASDHFPLCVRLERHR